MMQHLLIKILPLLISAVLLQSVAAWANPGRLSGAALFGMSDYRAEVSGVEAEQSSSQYEQVSLRYEKENLIADARLGRYTLMLGYEFNSIQPEKVVNGVNDATVSSIRTDKLFYHASVLLAPGALPFRISLFAHDIQGSAIIDDVGNANLPVGNQDEGGTPGRMLSPDIPIDLYNGTHRTIGGTLLLGIRNGSYLGAYRDVLSQVPRFLADFKQTENEDLHSNSNPTHSRDRNLAFVSLNKKDNWVHYRIHDYVDFLNPENNSQTTQYMLGTIDHLLQRNWINLTNWIKISGDMSYTVEETKVDDSLKTHVLNFMAVSNREGIKSSVLPRFNRENNGLLLSTSAELPIYVTADLNRDTRIRTRFIFESKERSLFEGQSLSLSDSENNLDVGRSDLTFLYLDNQLDLQRSRPMIIRPRIEVETRNQGDKKDGLATRLGAEVLSNNQLDKAFSWMGGYALAATKTNDELRGESASLLQNEIYGRIDKTLSRTLQVGGKSRLTSGSRGGREGVNFLIQTLSTDILSGDGDANFDSSYDGRITSGDISLYLEHLYHRLSNRLDLGYAFISADNVASEQSSLRYLLSYNTTVHRLKWVSALFLGDDPDEPRSVSMNYLAVGSNNSRTSASWDSNFHYFYDPNRSTALVLDGAISSEKADSNAIDYKLAEKLSYRIFTTNGIIRRLAEFSEEIGYEKVGESVNGRDSSLYGRVTAIYAPTKYLYGKLRSEMVVFMGSSALQKINTGEVGFDFEKFKVIASYSLANKDRESDLLPEVMERRWDFKVKKIF